MTKKDYILIADVLRIALETLETSLANWKGDKTEAEQNYQRIKIVIGTLIDGLCYKLKADNPRFNEVKFKEACGVKIINY